MVKIFKYTKSGMEGLVERKVVVLNEDATRIGGFDLTGVPEEEAKKVEEYFKDHVVKGFERRPKDAPKPEYETKFNYPYKAFSKAKIAEFNPVVVTGV